VKSLLVVFYVGSIFMANWFVQNVGEQFSPTGPHVIPVWPGIFAPSGVLWVGAALVLRDMVQFFLGRRVSVTAMLGGALLSYLVAPNLAFASAAAFLISETADLLVYTPLIQRRLVVPAVFASSTVGLVVDSVVFLTLAFGSLEFIEGQIIGKLWMTMAAAVVIWALRRRYPQALLGPSVAQ